MKKILSMLMVSIFTLAGCGSNEAEDIAGSTITVGISGSPTEIKTYKELGEKFTEESGVEIEFRQYTDFATEIQAELIGGTAPDVFGIDAYYFPFFAEQGVFAPVNEDLYDMDQYNENLLDSFKIDGELYALPKDYSTLALYYNKEYVNPEDIPSSYEDLGPYLEQLQTELPSGVVPMTFNIDLARQMYLAQSSGDQIIKPDTGMAQLDNENVAKNLSLEFDLAKDGLLTTPADLGVGWNGEAFGTGKTALMLEGNWVIGELDNNYSDIDYGVQENLSADGSIGSMLFTVGWGVNAATKNQAAAEAYVQFMSTADSVQYQTEQNGTLPARADVTESLGLDKSEIYGPHVKASEYATIWQAGNTLQAVNTEYMNYAPSVVSGDRTIEEALAQTDKDANRNIEENLE